MSVFLLGTVGFILYFIYDINSVTFHHKVLHLFFALGSLLLVISTVWKVIASWTECGFGVRIVCIAGAVVFGVLLIYTLFFAIPFEETYRQDDHERLAYTKGVYALCRHPGVLMFAGLYLCLWGMTGNRLAGVYFVCMILWNVAYIILQDLWSFPKTFSNYREYQKETPFLIPTPKSVGKCLKRL